MLLLLLQIQHGNNLDTKQKKKKGEQMTETFFPPKKIFALDIPQLLTNKM